MRRQERAVNDTLCCDIMGHLLPIYGEPKTSFVNVFFMTVQSHLAIPQIQFTQSKRTDRWVNQLLFGLRDERQCSQEIEIKA